MANIGSQQTRKDGYVEPALVTIGDDLNTVAQFLKPGSDSYGAADVVASLLSLVETKSPAAEPALTAEPSLAHERVLTSA
jgi:nitronate monooxygenase